MILLEATQILNICAIGTAILFVCLFILIFPVTLGAVYSDEEYKHYGFFRKLWIALTTDAKAWLAGIALAFVLAMPGILVNNFIFQQSTTEVDETYVI